MNIKIATTEKEKQQIQKVRKTVFVDEQNVPIEEEIDGHEESSIHFLCQVDEQAIGAGRLRFESDYGKLERICVLKPFRGQSYGKQIIQAIENEIKQQNVHNAKLGAQTHAISFYENLGYEIVSDVFMDAGIPHVMMKKSLS